MARIGRINTLPVIKSSDIGLFLDGDTRGEILLPRRYVPQDREFQPGDEVEVFLYFDSEDRPIATTLTPKVMVGGFANLKVVSVERVGLFLDWGLPKDLLLPHSEEKNPLQVGDHCIVHVMLDPRSGRPIATARLDRHLDQKPAHYRTGEEVRLLVAAQTDLGFKVIVNDKHWGLVHHTELFRPLRVGQRTSGFVKPPREDGKLAISLQPFGRKGGEQLADKILDALREAGGSLPLGDKSSPEEISRRFGVSKGAFKKAIGGLYKQGQIQISEDGIRLP